MSATPTLHELISAYQNGVHMAKSANPNNNLVEKLIIRQLWQLSREGGPNGSQIKHLSANLVSGQCPPGWIELPDGTCIPDFPESLAEDIGASPVNPIS
jgi:hypothetical protein